jgi:hypothetical protein
VQDHGFLLCNSYLFGEALNHFEAHAGIMVRAFPETGFVVYAIDFAILTTPMPFTSFVVNDVVEYILPSLV